MTVCAIWNAQDYCNRSVYEQKVTSVTTLSVWGSLMIRLTPNIWGQPERAPHSWVGCEFSSILYVVP